MIIWGGYMYDTSGHYYNDGGRYSPSTDSWTATSTGANCPTARYEHTVVWTNTEMIVWGGYHYNSTQTNTGGRYNPSTDSWAATSTGTNCPWEREYHTAVWTGTEMIIWGGYYQSGGDHYDNDGGRYNPSSNTWTATSTGANCPSARCCHTAVWTGSEMVIWGGSPDRSTGLNSGARYDPTSNTWTATSTGANCPSVRMDHSAIWSGTEMIVWGGGSGFSTNSGGRYNPSTDSWVATFSNGVVTGKMHTAIWTGTQMIAWGGQIGYSVFTNTGGQYTPSTDSWTATSTGANCPVGRYCHTAVWTGTEMVVWGGRITGTNYNTGGKYNPVSDSWLTTSTGANCPSLRSDHTAVWTGTEMIVWGGGSGSSTNTGGRYTPSSDTWTATSTGTNCPSARSSHTAVWTGTEMIIWGGGGCTGTGGRYTPSSDTWTTTSTGTNCPTGRFLHTAVWTGTQMIVWGGNCSSTYYNTGGRYTPSSDTWTATSTGTNCPISRSYGHTAIWTDTDIIIWGGQTGSGTYTNTGGRYTPSSDSWNPTSTGENCPSARAYHTMIWTGDRAIVWGGHNRPEDGAIYYSNTQPRALPALSTSLGSDAIFTTGLGETLNLNGSASTDGSNPATTTPYHDELDSVVSYEWDLNGDANLGTQCATSSSGIDATGVTPASLGDADLLALGICSPGPHTIWLRVTDEAGEKSCGSTTLTVGAASCIAPSGLANNTAADVSACEDTGVQITWSKDAGAWGDGGYCFRSYDVLRGGSAIASGLAYGTLSYTDTTGTNGTAYVYSVRYNNGCALGAATAGTSATDATVPSSVNVTPNGTTLACTGASITFTATPTGGTLPYTYQWTENGTDVSGATNSTYAPVKGSASSFLYNCMVAPAGCGSPVSDATASTGSWVAPPASVDVTPNGTTTLCTTANIVFTAAITGGATPLYQWTQNGSNISGATNSTYTVTKASAGSFTYNCKVNNTGCATTTQDGTASTGNWVAPPSVSVTPNGTTAACVGANITFTATASSGTTPYTYQWTEGGTDISGATGSTYTVIKASAGTYSYNCKAYSTGCATPGADGTASVGSWIAPPSSVDVTPDGTVTACTGVNIVLVATANGGSNLLYQWTQNGSNISGATSSNYTVTKATAGAFTFNCKVNSSGCSTVVQDATASTGSWVAPPTSVDVTPNGTTSACIDGNITLSVACSGGTAPFSYQWTENGSDLTGATNSTLTVSKASAGSYTYNCKAASAGCATTVQDATSSTGQWAADAAPSSVDVTPDAGAACPGSIITFIATASGGLAPYTYQWTENGLDISGATNSTYIASKASAGFYSYNCWVSNNGCVSELQDAWPSTGSWVAPPTSVDVTPNGTTTTCTGSNIVLTAAVAGGSTPLYQWTENGSDISGATNSTLAASKASAGSHTYNCKVKNTGCSTQVQDSTASTGAWVSPPASVDVAPSGTTAICLGVSMTFTATVTGGTTPYSYQWTENGSDIFGATSSTYSTSKTGAGTYTYNCSVYSANCSTPTLDASPSSGSWVSSPTVDVLPNGTTSACTGISIVFTASASGGTAPYTTYTSNIEH